MSLRDTIIMNLIWRNEVKKSFAGSAVFFATIFNYSALAFGAELRDWAIWHQPAASEMMERIEWFDAYIFWFIVPITLFVMALLFLVMIRFNAKANPVPSTTTHNLYVELVWTIVPIVILMMIAVPSFNLLARQINPPTEPDMTIKAVGYQWYWGYEYQDGTEISFESVLIGREKYSNPDAAKKERDEYGKSDEDMYPYLMAVDNELVVPVGKTVRVLVTAADVIHAFTVPSLGFKIDAVPGRMNEIWFKANREGLFYGQCSELCGRDHAFMPIAIRVVSEEQFATWKSVAAGDVESANKALMAAVEGVNASLKVAAKQ
jgi:cytochrome c oxidase subunit 2